MATRCRRWTPAGKPRLAAAAVRAGALRSIPRAPAAELRPRGRRHSRERDQRAVTHHYDVSNEFFRLFLGESMTYSCAIFSRGAQTLEEAQETKLELVCTKLGLQAGERVLDVGCGWGSFALHAARQHGVRVTGITLSSEQAALARSAFAPPACRTRSTSGCRTIATWPASNTTPISSIGMVEHVGSANVDAYAAQLASVLRPGGGCSTTALPGCGSAIPRRARSPSASCSPTRRRCTSRGS